MFDFAVKGAVVGFNPSQDGTKVYVKIQPQSVNGVALQRDERFGLVDIQVPVAASKNLAINASVLARGKGYVILRDWRDPKTNFQKTYTNVRFDVETVDLAKVA